MKNEYYNLMKNEIESSINDMNTKNFALYLLDNIPDYFFVIPASSSGKYHPKNDLGEGGLVRHSISVKRIVDHLLELEDYDDINENERDLIKVSALFHDCMKSGTIDEYVINTHTKFNHPFLAAAHIIHEADKYGYSSEYALYISSVIASHMGQWNINEKSGDVLPKPQTKQQKLLHLADYISSRKDINIEL